MRRYIFILPLILLPLIVLLFTGCPNPEEATSVQAPTITIHTAVGEGADFQITWTDNTDGDSEIFYIYAAGTAAIDSTFNLSYTIDETDRASEVSVTALVGDDESSKETHDLSLTETANLEVWTTADPSASHPSFVQFTNGHATAVSEANSDDATFYIGNATQLEGIHRWPGVTTSLEPAFADAASPYSLASGTGNYTDIWPAGMMAINATYYMWIDRAPTGTMGVEDDFVKIYVVNIVDDGGFNKATLNISFQGEDGLRWLVD